MKITSYVPVSFSVPASFSLQVTEAPWGRQSAGRPWKWLPLILLPLFFGCTAISLMVGRGEPDLTPIRHAGDRSQVEKVLGQPVWHAGFADGLIYEIYEFDAGRSAQPGFGAMGLFLDVASLGLMEAYSINKGDFDPVKQLAVTYDAAGRVRFISQPWLVQTDKPARRLRFHLPADSGVPADAQPIPLPNWTEHDETVAILEISSLDLVESIWSSMHVLIDGGETQRDSVTLKPGPHRVAFETDYGTFTNSIEVLPRRVYRLHIARYRFSRWCDVIWIDDVESHETLCWQHTKPPQP